MINMLHETKCPECGVSWEGALMLDTFIEQREEGVSVWQGKTNEEIEQYIKDNYSPPYRWGRQIGITDMGRDVTGWIACPDCKSIFERFGGKKTDRKWEQP